MSTFPTRLLILKRLCDVLEVSTPGEANDTFGTLKVFRGRSILGEEIKPLPAIAVIESPITDPGVQYVGDDYEMRRDRLTLLIQGRIADDKNDSTDGETQSTDVAYWLEAAIESRLARIQATDNFGKPLYPDEWNLGKLILDLEIGAPVVRPPEKSVSSTAFFFLPVRVGIAKQSDQPYTTV